MVVTLIATGRPGHNLRLIGGFRYRLLSRSSRMSVDIDYHWDGNLESKQSEITELLSARLLPEVRRRLGYEGAVRKATGPDADSTAVKTVELTFHRSSEPPDRIEIPVEITNIPCLDPPVVRTVGGTVYLTASDADMIESRVLALFNRVLVQERDIVDLFLFQDSFLPESPRRMKQKLDGLGIRRDAMSERYRKLLQNRSVHVRAIDGIVADQIDAAVAANLRIAGGGSMIFDAVLAILRNNTEPVASDMS